MLFRSNLDTELRVEMRREIKTLHQKTKVTVVYVTHDQGEALALAKRIVVMNHGKIEQVGTPQEIYARPSTPFVAKFVGRSNLISGKWEGNVFAPAGTRIKWESDQVAPVFHEAGQFPVKPEHLYLVDNGLGIPAVVEEIEYQGMEVRMMLRSKVDDTVLELRHRGETTHCEGDEVSVSR